MPDALPASHPLRTGSLSARKPTQFDLRPDAAQRRAIADLLGALEVTELSFKGAIRPVGRGDFALEGHLKARVTQPCVVTLEPVLTLVEREVSRRYLADFDEPTEAEAEMPEDDSAEPLGDVIDPAAVMIEDLALALPDYPRAAGAELPETVLAPPGVAPLRDSDLRPFSGLASLADRMKKSAEESGDGGEG